MIQDSKQQLIATVLKFLGPVFFIGLQGASLQAAFEIRRTANTGSASPLPYISLLTNCVIWTMYGWLRNDATVFAPNATGICTALVCARIFHVYAREKPWKLYSAALAILVVASILANAGAVSSIGLLGCILSVLLSGSPLAVMGTVWKEKSTASLPFAISLILWVNSFSWMSYGLFIANDPMIYGPNILGFALSCAQMSLFVLFGLPPKREEGKLSLKV